MTTMLAAVWYGPGRDNFRLERISRPEPAAGELVIRVKRCFFSAMHARAVLVGHPKLNPPEVLGRMLAGDIAAVGVGVDRVSLGMRVTVNPERPCEDCFYCHLGEWGHCCRPTTLRPGGMAEFVRIPVALVESVYEIPETVSYDEAAYAETLACTLQAIDLADVRATDCVVIIGCGGVGLTFVQLATARQASRVIVADRKDDALEQATALGAWRTVNVARESLAEVVAAETGGYGADVVVEAVGASETYEQALTLLRCGGRVVGFGGAHPGSEFRCDPNLIHYRSLKLFGAYRYAPDHYLRALGMIRAREVDLRPVLTHHVPFSRLTRDAVSIHSEPACRALIIDINEDT